MRRTMNRNPMYASFALAAALLVFASWGTYRSTAKASAAAEEKNSSYEILASLEATATRLVDTETAERGYVVTGDESYLQPYREALKNLDEILAGLKGRTAKEASQRNHIQYLEPLINKKLARTQEIILLRQKNGFAAAAQLIREGSGKQWMDEIRAVIAEMQEVEKERWSLQDLAMRKALASSVWTILLGNLAALTLLAVVFTFLINELGERRRAQEALEQRERWFSTTLSSVGDAVIATDANGTVNFLNTAAESITGWKLEEARGKFVDLVFDIMNADTRQPAETPIKNILREGKVVGLGEHRRLRRRDGKEFDIEDSAAPILADAGVGLGVVLVFRDITEKRRTEALNRAVLESAVDGITVIDEAGLIQSFNPAAEQSFGWKIGEVIGQNIKMLMPAPYHDAHDGYLRHYRETGEKKIIGIGRDVEGLRKDGTRFPMHLGVSEMRVGGRQLYVGMTRDISAQKQAEEAVKASEERLQLALESAEMGTWEMDLVKNRVNCDLRHDQIFGYASVQPEWRHEIFLAHVVPEDRDGAKKRLEEALVSGDYRLECRIFWPDQSIHWICAQGRVYRNDQGEPVRVIGMIADVTERKLAQEYLERAKEEAERASKFKDQFLSTMSHELRTPLNAVLGFSDLLMDERYGPLNDRQTRYVKHIRTGGKHLLKLISDILDLSKIEAGRMEISLENVPVAQAVSEVLDALHPLADQKEQTVVSQVEAKLHVWADPMRFKQVLLNLAGNAIKFTPEGGRIELNARQVEGKVRVEVIDSGPGIPAEEQQRIFEAFYRKANSGEAIEGTGLGLAISARLLAMQGGKLGLDSPPGQGACFYFTLPLVEIAAKPAFSKMAVNTSSGKGIRILVIEDDVATGQLIMSQLESSGYETIFCEKPEHAVAMAAELQPDAITLDVLMKPVHGLQVLLELKGDGRTSGIPVIIVSILDQPVNGRALGADEYLVKPVEKSVLLAAVERCLYARGVAPSGQSVLVVEDDPASREMIREVLVGQGYVVNSAEDGAAARASVDLCLPELVVLDLGIPKINGFELLAEWRGSPRTANLPVFVLTSKDLTSGEEKYIRAHAQSLFRKQESWKEELIRQLGRVVHPVSQE